MKRDFKEAVKYRRSNYSLSNKSTISDDEIKEIIDFAVLHTPSAFNNQTARVVLLLGDNHKKLWNITEDILKTKIASADAFAKTKAKIDGSFASGYGTILFYEDQEIIKDYQKQYPTYDSNFPLWSLQASGMLQFNVWTMLSDAGLGVSLQHYNPLIDEKVAEEWNIPSSWELISQMPFGIALEEPGKKSFDSLDKRVLIYK